VSDSEGEDLPDNTFV